MYALYSIVTTNKIWHKDDNGPYNSRKQRHHQAVQIEYDRIRQEMTTTFAEFKADTDSGAFPEDKHLVEVQAEEYAKFLAAFEA